jgi:hypothetical protein
MMFATSKSGWKGCDKNVTLFRKFGPKLILMRVSLLLRRVSLLLRVTLLLRVSLLLLRRVTLLRVSLLLRVYLLLSVYLLRLYRHWLVRGHGHHGDTGCGSSTGNLVSPEGLRSHSSCFVLPFDILLDFTAQEITTSLQ